MADKHYAHYLGVSEYFALNIACQAVVEAFGSWQHVGCYLVGSVLKRKDWRDVDVRLMMKDESFDALFGKDQHDVSLSPLLLLNTAVSEWLQKRTGLPIDFQFQQMTAANAEFPRADDHVRNAIGIVTTNQDLIRQDRREKEYKQNQRVLALLSGVSNPLPVTEKYIVCIPELHEAARAAGLTPLLANEPWPKDAYAPD